MEKTEEDYDTIVTLRVPISLARKVEQEVDWGLPRKKQGRKAEAYRSAILEGVQFKTLQNDAREDPEKREEVQEKFLKMLMGENTEQVLETVDLSGLDTIITIASMVRNNKAKQMILES
jgi:hypothetical protein